MREMPVNALISRGKEGGDKVLASSPRRIRARLDVGFAGWFGRAATAKRTSRADDVGQIGRPDIDVTLA